MKKNKSRESKVKIKNPVQKRSRETRQKIIEAAKHLISENGFHDTTTKMIAKEAEISIGSVYAHFEDKIEIFLKIHEDHSEIIYNYTRMSLLKNRETSATLAEAIDWLIPGLYEASKMFGKLNIELNKFISMNVEAQAIHDFWEKKADEDIYNFFKHYKKQIKYNNLKIAASIIQFQLRELFQYIFKNEGRVDEEQYLNEFQTMLKNLIR